MEQLLKSEAIQKTKIFYTTGFFLESNQSATYKLAEYAHAHSKLFAFNLAAEYLLVEKKSDVLSMIEYSDILFCNKDEALAVGEQLQDELHFSGLAPTEQNEEANLISIAQILAKY
jgi:sugar/nucleoside kinase (ribokinase family)